MPTNVCIDVDLTLVDEAGELLPGAREALIRLRAAGCRLTLWSAAGAQYAKSVAERHTLEAHFEGFAGKPDIVIDDDLRSLTPKRVIAKHADTDWGSLAAKVEQALSEIEEEPAGNRVVALVEDEMNLFEKVHREYAGIFQHNDNLYPIPFFGDIRRAEVITVALNPAPNEFSAERQWPARAQPTGLTATALTSRLLHYFDLPSPRPHNFFSRQYGDMLLWVHSAYARNVAHVDLLPFPTVRPTDMGLEQRRKFVELLRLYGDRLSRVLALASCAKVVLVAGWAVNDGDGGTISVWKTFVKNCGILRERVAPDGRVLPVLLANRELVFEKRYDICEHLISGPLLNLPPND